MAKIEVKVPDIGDFKDVPIIEILVKPGESVKAEQSLVTLESDKATMDVPAPASGQAGGVKDAGPGWPRSRGSGSGACETSSARESCLRSDGGTAHDGRRCTTSGRASSAGADGTWSGSGPRCQARRTRTRLASGRSVARCGTGSGVSCAGAADRADSGRDAA